MVAGASCQVTVNLNLSKDKAVVGDNLTVTCHVTSSNPSLISLVTWMKRAGDEETEIGTNRFVNEVFKQTRRYEAELKYDEDKPEVIDFMLNIKGELLHNFLILGLSLQQWGLFGSADKHAQFILQI